MTNSKINNSTNNKDKSLKNKEMKSKKPEKLLKTNKNALDQMDENLPKKSRAKPKKDQSKPAPKTDFSTFLTIPLRDLVIFPKTNNAILVGREASMITLQEARAKNEMILVATQIDSEDNHFSTDSLYSFATLCKIVESIKTNDGNIKAIIYGVSRVLINKAFIDENGLLKSEGKEFLEENEDEENKGLEIAGLVKACIKSFTQFCDIEKKINRDRLLIVNKSNSFSQISFIIASTINFSVKEKHQILSSPNLHERLSKILELIQVQIEISQTEEKITKSIQEKIAKNQKQIYLNERIKEIKEELGGTEKDDMEELKSKIQSAKMPKEAFKKIGHEFSKLEKMSPYASESNIVRNYIEYALSLPWLKQNKDNKNLLKAKEILDKEHFGLEKVKERILEFIAVQIKTKSLKGPILCLVGAPGVGKTSLAKSIANSLNKKYVKISLGGLRDEAEIRGHRRTYIGAMPGKIIQAIKKAETGNPLILLDEIDKMAFDFRGDPSSAMLEVLDPEQNNNFCDHYLEIAYDLSKIMFVATANSIANIPIPLRDRMEVIKISGYTEQEKLNIAKNYLIPKQKKENGLSQEEFGIEDEAILKIIRNYTFEAGVRNLNREIANLARKTTKEIVINNSKSIIISVENLAKFAGIHKFEFGTARQKNTIGVATGLAFTEYGGDLLDIEALKFEGSGKIQITGKLGEVMKESVQTALSYARSISCELKIDAKEFNSFDFHIHVPEGATPKDGPSAGIAICLALISIISQKEIKKTVAMTGEITLTGKILAIGGLREKLLAATRGGISTALIPKENEKDLSEIPEEITKKLNIITVSHISEVIEECLIS